MKQLFQVDFEWQGYVNEVGTVEIVGFGTFASIEEAIRAINKYNKEVNQKVA